MISLPIVSTRPVNIVAGVTVLICKGRDKKLGSVDLGFGARPERCRRRFGGVSIYPNAPFNLPGPRCGGVLTIVRSFCKQSGTVS